MLTDAIDPLNITDALIVTFDPNAFVVNPLAKLFM